MGQGRCGFRVARAMTGVDILHVPYKTGTAAVAALVAGQIDLLFFNAIGVLPQVQSGRIRALAITSAERSPLVSGVATISSKPQETRRHRPSKAEKTPKSGVVVAWQPDRAVGQNVITGGERKEDDVGIASPNACLTGERDTQANGD